MHRFSTCAFFFLWLRYKQEMDMLKNTCYHSKYHSILWPAFVLCFTLASLFTKVFFCFAFFLKKAGFFSWNVDFLSSQFHVLPGSCRSHVKAHSPLWERLWKSPFVFPYLCVRFLNLKRNSLKLSGRYSWNSPGSFCPNSLLLPIHLGPGNKMEEFLIYSSAKSTDMDLNLPSRLLHGNGYGTTPMFCVSCREFKFQPRNNSKYLVAATSTAVLASSAGLLQIIL